MRSRLAVAVACVFVACDEHPTSVGRTMRVAPPLALALAAQTVTCSAPALISAITAANLAGEGTLDLATGCTYTLTAVNNFSPETGINGLPPVTGDITINGNGATIKRDSLAPDFRIFYVLNSGDPAHGPGRLIMNNVTIRGGRFSNSGGGLVNDSGTVALTNADFTDNESGDNGGGVANIAGTLTLIQSVVSGNQSSDFGGGVSNRGGTLTLDQSTVSGNGSSDKGGGVANDSGGVVRIVNGSVISENQAGDQGGGVNNSRGGTLIIDNSTVTDNFANDDGGGVANDSGTVTIRNHSTISNNGAGDDGAGVANTNGGQLTIDHSSILGNISGETGGGLVNYDATAIITASTVATNRAKWGAGLFNEGTLEAGILTVRNSTISGNVAEEAGGGVYNYKGGTLTLVATTVAGNSATIKPGGGVLSYNDINGRAEIKGSIAAGNAPDDVAAVEDKTRYISLGYNVIGRAGPMVNFSVDFRGPGDQRNVTNPGLGPLQNNGGPTLTRALLTGSPALNVFATCTDEGGTTIGHDQRGVTRPVGVACDAGAFEREGSSAPQTILFDQPASPRTYGTVFTVNPTATSGLPVALAAAGGCTASGYTVTMTSGTTACVLTASQPGGGGTPPAASVVHTVAAQKQSLTVTVLNEAIAEGGTPSFDITHTGFVSGDGAHSLGGALVLTFAGTGATVYGPSTTTPTARGTYSVAPGGYSSTNYEFTYVTGAFIIGGGIRFESQTTAANAGATTLIMGRPAGLQAGDLLLAQVTFEKGSAAGTNITPSGWTLVRRTNRTTDLGQAVFYRIAGASEPVQYTWTFSQLVKAAGSIMRYSSVNTGSPIVTSSGNTGASGTLTASGVTTTAGSVVVALYGLKKNSTSLSVPAGMTARHYFESPLGLALRGADQARAAAGATGSRVSIAGHAEKWIAQLVALRPQ